MGGKEGQVGRQGRWAPGLGRVWGLRLGAANRLVHTLLEHHPPFVRGISPGTGVEIRNPRQEGPDLSSHPGRHGLWGCDPLGPQGSHPPTKWGHERGIVLGAGQEAGQGPHGQGWPGGLGPPRGREVLGPSASPAGPWAWRRSPRTSARAPAGRWHSAASPPASCSAGGSGLQREWGQRRGARVRPTDAG